MTSGCEWVEPIRVSRSAGDVFSDGTAKQILAHNRAWEANCGD